MQTNGLRILQLIDSLSAGGAERVSVNLANALAEEGVSSFLCATRKSGPLEQFILPQVDTLILNKSSAVDLRALNRLINYIKINKINIIHAHSSSFFMAVLCKPFTDVRIVWHDHNGERYKCGANKNQVLRQFSRLFNFVIAVNEKLAKWSHDNLYINNECIIYLPNFAQLTPQDIQLDLPGCKDKRIVCLANLRWQKDHMTLLKAFSRVYAQHPDWHLLMVGQDSNDEYSDNLKSYISQNGLAENVHILGSRNDTADILLASTVGVISSETEGLPVALLEYGLAKLAVVCTDVGQCADVLGAGKYGLVVDPKDTASFADALQRYMTDESFRNKMVVSFQEQIKMNYSTQAVIRQLVSIYRWCLNG